VRQQPAHHRTRDARHREHAADVALIAPALAQRHDVGDDRLRDRDQAAAPQSLKHACGNQLRHGLGQRAGQRRKQEKRDR
jgi:hypothetical protein